MKFLKQKSPILLSLFISSLFFAVLSQAGRILQFIPWALEGSEYRYQLCGEIIAAAFALGIIFLFRNSYVFKRKGIGFGKGLLPSLYIIIISAYTGMTQYSNCLATEYELAPVFDIVIFLLSMIMVGFTEEVIYRGFISEIIFEKYGKTPAGVWFSVITSGCIFGFMHMVNVKSGGDVSSSLVQSICASVIGMAFCAIYYRTKNLYVCIFLHTIINVSALLPTGFFQAYTLNDALSSYTSINFIGAVPYLILTVLLLRPDKMKDVVKTPAPSKRGTIIVNTILGVALFMAAVITAYALLPQTIETLKEIMLESAQFTY